MVLRFWLALVILAFFLVGAPSASSQPSKGVEGGARASIIGGTSASIASFPWVAHISHRGAIEEFDCTGTVVAPRLVLTAAHCVLTETGRVAAAQNFTVLTGTADRTESLPERRSSVAQVLVFPGYVPSKVYYDAALLVLVAPVSVPALPLAAPAEAALRAPDVRVAVAGWGLTKVKPSRLPTILQSGSSVIQDTGRCQRSLRRVLGALSPASQLCVRSSLGSRASLCDGDSGGPAIAWRPDGSSVQVGIVSLKGSLHCGPRFPQVLTRVDQVSWWVDLWRAAIEGRGAMPEVSVPRVELPRVTRGRAAAYSGIFFQFVFGNDFSRGTGHAITCQPGGRTRIKCRVEWLRFGLYFRGAFTFFSVLPREGSPFRIRYRIRRFTARCWFTYLNPKRYCGYRLFKG